MNKFVRESTGLVFWVAIYYVLIKLISKFYLLNYPHAFVWQYYSVVKYLLLIVIVIFSFEKSRVMVIYYYRKSEILFFLLTGVIVIGSFFVVSAKNGLNLVDDTVYYETGFDQLTYTSWSRDILQNKSIFVEPTVTYSKPFYLYFRAILINVFGDGNMRLDTFGVWMLGLLPVGLFLVVLMNTQESHNLWLKRVVITSMAVFWYLVVNGWLIRFVSNLSEMPAWFFMGVATILSLDRKISEKYVFGFLLMSVLMRTVMLVYIPMLLLILYTDRTINFKKMAIYLSGGVLVVLLHSWLGGFFGGGVSQYVLDNTSVHFWQRVEELVPTSFELLVWLWFSLSFVLASSKNKLMIISVVVVSLLAQLPLLNNFYPQRNVFWFYWMLTVVALRLL